MYPKLQFFPLSPLTFYGQKPVMVNDRSFQADGPRRKGLTYCPCPARKFLTTGASNMLQLDETETAIAFANPVGDNFELVREIPRHEQARRTTDVLRLRNREAVVGLWNGREELAAGLLAPQAWIPSKYFYDSLGSQL